LVLVGSFEFILAAVLRYAALCIQLGNILRKSVVPNLFCPKVYFSSSHHPEIYQSRVSITNLYTSYPACSK